MVGPAKSKSPRSGPSGAALVIVLLLLTILSILAAEFLYELRIQTMLIHNQETKTQARYVARAGTNAGFALLKHKNPEDQIFNNEFIRLFKYECSSMSNTDIFEANTNIFEETEEEEKEKEEETPAPLSGCGEWSLAIPYAMDDTLIDLEIHDEQARININAIARISTNKDGDVTMGKNDIVVRMIYELFRYEAFVNEIEISDLEIHEMIEMMWHYVDGGNVDGSFDSDPVNFLEYDDVIIPMKNGPFDTVDEIRYMPGMNDELFDAVKNYLTVYPSNQGQFMSQINIHAAPVEVLYAFIRGATYKGSDPDISEEDALEYAHQIVNSYQEDDQNTALTPNAVSVPPYKRVLPPELNQYGELKAMMLNVSQMPRFYRLISTAVSEDEIQTRITKVVRLNQNRTIETMYFKEE